ncbi:MAG TPA: hypothetical protein VFL86_09770 [Burkholderiaceae bacterium]|nr:hypothetical protein [Burkholderiaceae bacterium]
MTIRHAKTRGRIEPAGWPAAAQRATGAPAVHFIDNRPQAAVQRRLIDAIRTSHRALQLSAVQAAVGHGGQVVQAKWTGEQETEAQKKLAETDGTVVEVPAANILNQQAWMKGAQRGMAIKLPGGGWLQGIKADKVIERAIQIAKGAVKVDPPPVAFSTGTAAAADFQSGELILLDSHHTKNAALLLSGAETMSVEHHAKPAVKGAENMAQVAASREAITKNMLKAASYNAAEGAEAYQEAADAIANIKDSGQKPEDNPVDI